MTFCAAGGILQAEREPALYFYELDLRYVMVVCLGISLIYDIITLRSHPVFTLAPLGLGFIVHLQHGTVKAALAAFFLPFALNLVRFIKRDVALYDLLDLSMIGVIMGWPFGLLATVLAKLTYVFINRTWVVKLLGRHKGGYEYAFPYTVVIVVGAALTYYVFKIFPAIEKQLLTIYP